MNTLWKYAAFAALILLSFACEKESGNPVDSSLVQPLMVSVVVSPNNFNLDSLAGNGSFDGSQYRLRIVVKGAAVKAGGSSLTQISYRLLSPLSSQSIQYGTLAMTTSADTAHFNDTITFTLSRSDIGHFLVEVTAKNADGASSNARQTSFTITRRNSRPRILRYIGPDTLQRPAEGDTVFSSFAVSVADSDGLSDIKVVTFQRLSPAPDPNNPGPFQMFDDGDRAAHQDQTANDGIFSTGLQIFHTALLGDQVFLFRAIDKSDSVSATFTHKITFIDHIP